MHPEDKSYEFYGFYEFTANMGANHLKSGLKGPNNIVFKDGQHIRFRAPDFKLGGTVMGERSIEANGNIVFEDLTNNLKAVVLLSTYQKTGFFKVTETGKRDEIKGVIYECEPCLNVQPYSRTLYAKSSLEINDLNKIKDNKKHVCDITGSWLRNLVIGDKVYWDIESDTPFR